MRFDSQKFCFVLDVTGRKVQPIVRSRRQLSFESNCGFVNSNVSLAPVKVVGACAIPVKTCGVDGFACLARFDSKDVRRIGLGQYGKPIDPEPNS